MAEKKIKEKTSKGFAQETFTTGGKEYKRGDAVELPVSCMDGLSDESVGLVGSNKPKEIKIAKGGVIKG